MTTKVFISWSGELSRKLAEALRNWLPAALQHVKPYFSPDDIEKGARWNTEIAGELGSSNIGVICLTQDNIDKPWILFESGALSKALDRSRVCTLLFNLEATELKGPLTSFQATKFGKEDFKRLVSTINSNAAEAKLDLPVLDSVFEMWWPRLDDKVQEVLATHDPGPQRKRRSDRDILEEILELTRLSAERAHTSRRMSPRAMTDLMESLFYLLSVSIAQTGEMDGAVVQRAERALRHICFGVGVPEIYEEFRSRMRDLGQEGWPVKESPDASGIDLVVEKSRTTR